MPRHRLWNLLALVILMACGDSGGGGKSLQSECVADHVSLTRTLADGQSCSNVGYTDCGATAFASRCKNECAFDLCQPGECASDAECLAKSATYECASYVVSGTSYGSFCGVASCPLGTPGCRCLPDAKCTKPDSYWTVSCSAQNLCQGTDSCPSGCRAGSVCCGGGFCSGDCAGTPCCH